MIAERPIRNISDTAAWAAVYRARETERRDALFRDPFARRLAGERGERILASMPARSRNDWAWVTRTLLFDRFIEDRIARGAGLVVNLAAGLDARPYRMRLPTSLPWIEVDLPDLLAYKEEVLGGEKPACTVERIALDLSDAGARRVLFERLGRRAAKAVVITEGLLIYLAADAVGALARDLAAVPAFRHWVLDLVSPGLLRLMQRQVGDRLGDAGAALRFGPEEGPGFFTPHGWRPADVRSIARTAAGVGRAPLLVRLLTILPDSTGRQGPRPWGGVCLMDRADSPGPS